MLIRKKPVETSRCTQVAQLPHDVLIKVRAASEDAVKERRRSRNAANGDGRIYDDELPALDYDAGEEYADGDFEHHHCCYVRCFAGNSSLFQLALAS